MAKRYIKIHPKMITEWPKLSRNQILMCLVLFYSDTELLNNFKKKYYGKSKLRYLKDIKRIKEYGVYLNEMVYYNDNAELKRTYMKLKISTLKLILDNNMKKQELLVMLYLLWKYQFTYRREFTIGVKELLKEVFNYERHNITPYKRVLFKTLDLLKSWVYEDGAVFVKGYTIIGDRVRIELEEAVKRRAKR